MSAPGTEIARSPRAWPASLELALTCADGRTRLARNRHHGPLRVQRPFYPEAEDCCHLYLLHPPGGLVSGDRLAVQLRAGPGTRSLVTTPAAGKVYRAAPTGEQQVQSSHIEVSEGACVEWLPQDNIVFDGARGELALRLDLQGNGCFIGWEMTCLGRAAGGHPFKQGQLIQRLQVYQDGRPLLLERMDLDATGEAMEAPWGLDHNTLMATALVTLAGTTLDQAESLLSLSREDWGDWPLAGVTQVRGLLIVRALGSEAHRLRAHLQGWWQRIRPVRLGRSASPPRIWLT